MNHAIPLIPGKYGTAGKRILTFGLQVPYFKHIPIFFSLSFKNSRNRTNVRDQILHCKAVQKRDTWYWFRIAGVNGGKGNIWYLMRCYKLVFCSESTQIREENRLIEPEARKIQRAMD